jgi:acetyl/propionyl-CoA carboxylase alpha subunit
VSDEVAAARGPIRVLFIANRGEIAVRIATTAHRLRIVPVVPLVGGADGGEAAPVRRDDGGFGRPAADPVDLLDPADVVRAALAAGADAVHPGYGFLAESPALAEAVVAAGLVWVGPPPDAIRTLGDKARAREAARRVDVPVAAGEEPDDQSDASLAASADRIGLPLLVKPAAGGGGKGIRVVRRRDELQPAVEAARREAARAFGDDRLIVERYVVPARHVEVQVLADAHGGVIHLGDRDCSLQRRHQKVLEEAPAPGLAPELRAVIRAAAVRVARAVGYEGAGTCEFLVGDDGSWVFLEMNARLQVEHPVTELVLGRDLVADQLRVAEGAGLAELGLDQGDVEAALVAGGHAVEVRLNAEDPSAGFLPSAGPVLAVRWPDGAGAFGPARHGGIRVDAGIAAGDLVGGAFDPLLAKIIAHGSNRGEALVRLAGALDETEVLGLVTNLAFLRRLVRLAVVREGRARTETLEGLAGEAAATTSIPEGAWQVAAEALAGAADGNPWRGGWRLNAPARLRLAADGPAGPEERSVELTSTAAAAAAPGAPEIAGPAPAPLAVRDGDVVHVSVGGRSVPFRFARPPELARTASRRGSAGAESATDLVAPMPGTVLGVHVAVGGSVEAGDPVATLEAMKMEHVVSAPRAGRVAGLFVKAGDRVERGRLVARLEVQA